MVIGTIVGILFAFGYIPFIVTSAWLALGIGIFSLIVFLVALFISALFPQTALQKCLCKNARCLLVGIFGTIISALAVLSLGLTNAFVLVIIVVAIAAFFFSLLMLGLISFIKCLVDRICD